MYCKFLYVGDINKDKVKNKMFQCVFQYLKRFDAGINLSDFVYKEPFVEGDYFTCISTIKKYVCFSLFIHKFVF